jgi:uncharacterized membrane protein YgcG
MLAILLLVPAVVMGQTCDATVADDAGGILNTAQMAQIASEAGSLINQGADVRVRVTGTTANLDQTEAQYEHSCPSWQGASGGRKNSLVVLMVSPSSRKLGIYYGSAFKYAFDEHWVRIKSDYMVPKFRDHDWTGGFIATEQQLAARLTAAKDESVHPVAATTVVTEPPTDYSGLWSAFKWALLILALVLFCYGIWEYYSWCKRRREAAKAAQQAASIRRNLAARRISRFKSFVNASNQALYDRAVDEFGRLSNSESTNPDTDGLTPQQYYNIERLYKSVCNDLDEVAYPTGQETVDVPAGVTCSHPSDEAMTGVESAGDAPVDSTTYVPVIIDNSRVNEAPETEPSTYNPFLHETPTVQEDPEPSPDDDNGGSSSFTESSGSSSSSDDGGGSSSWSSESSDSGGSSDFSFGGGGDSGGGGGSDSF